MRPLYWTASLVTGIASATAVSPGTSPGPELPFTVLIVEWRLDALEQQRSAYQREAAKHEVVFCIEAWHSLRSKEGIEHIVVERVRRERAGAEHGVKNVGDDCMAADRKPLPMFHTHSDGNCQFSPSDLVTAVGRGAPYEGIQCGDHYFVWIVASQVVALANRCDVVTRDDAGVHR